MGSPANDDKRIALAVPAGILSEMRRLVREQTGSGPSSWDITDGKDLMESIRVLKPDILILDLTLPNLDEEAVLAAFSSAHVPLRVLATAPRCNPYLLGLQKHRVVKGALPRVLALSPVLCHVLAGIAAGSEYFAPAPLDYQRSGLTSDELILLALMAMGRETVELARDLGCSTHVVYSNQSRLRKKLHVQTNPQAILAAIRMGLVGVLTGHSDSVVRSELY